MDLLQEIIDSITLILGNCMEDVNIRTFCLIHTRLGEYLLELATGR
jgi:hypothetical protein